MAVDLPRARQERKGKSECRVEVVSNKHERRREGTLGDLTDDIMLVGGRC
jgi:hypothetical protein